MAETHMALESLQTSSETVRRFLSALHEGVVGVFDNHDEELEVVEAGTPAMSVVVEPGSALVGLAPEGCFYTNSADNPLTIADNSSGSTRYDYIVVELDLSQSAGSDTCELKVVQGTPGAGVPSLTQTASVYQLGLATVEVADGETAITDSEITDARSFILSATSLQQYIEKASDQTATSTTLEDDDDFSFACEANSTYKVQALIYVVSETTPDYKATFSVPGSSTVDGQIAASNATAAVATLVEGAATFVLLQSGTDQVLLVTVTIQTDSAGNITYQFAKSSSGGTGPTHKAGSWMEWKKVA